MNIPLTLTVLSRPRRSLACGSIGGRRRSCRVARAYFLFVGAAALAVTVPFLDRLDRTRATGSSSRSSRRRRGRAALRGRDAAEPVVPHDVVFLVPAALLLPPELVALIALVSARARLAEAPLPLAHPGVQHRELHDRDDGGVGGGTRDPAHRPDRATTSLRLRRRRSRPASSSSCSTTRCSRRCSASRRALRSASPASSRSTASRPTSCSRRSASRSRTSGP